MLCYTDWRMEYLVWRAICETTVLCSYFQIWFHMSTCGNSSTGGLCECVSAFESEAMVSCQRSRFCRLCGISLKSSLNFIKDGKIMLSDWPVEEWKASVQVQWCPPQIAFLGLKHFFRLFNVVKSCSSRQRGVHQFPWSGLLFCDAENEATILM